MILFGESLPMKSNLAILGLWVVLLSNSACDPGSEKAFIRGKSEVACLQNIPACPGLFASCQLDGASYTQKRLPDDTPFRFLVAALPNERIEILMFFVSQSDSGLDTRIMWYEPGCSDVVIYKSEGANLFKDFEDTGIFSHTETVYDGGDHLIEIFSDMQAVVDITAVVSVPER